MATADVTFATVGFGLCSLIFPAVVTTKEAQEVTDLNIPQALAFECAHEISNQFKRSGHNSIVKFKSKLIIIARVFNLPYSFPDAAGCSAPFHDLLSGFCWAFGRIRWELRVYMPVLCRPSESDHEGHETRPEALVDVTVGSLGSP